MLEYKGGVDSFMSSTVNRYSNEFKQQLVELFQSGQSVTKLSREYGKQPQQSTNGQKNLHQ